MTTTASRRVARASAIVLTVAIGWSLAHGAETASGTEADRDAIRQHIDRIFKAYIGKNRGDVQATHDRDWRGFLTGSPSIIKGIDDYMRAADVSLTSRQSGLKDYRMEQFDVQFRGNGLAVVPYVAEVTGEAEGLSRTYRLRVLDVYEKQNGDWMQIASNTAMHPRSTYEQMSEPQTLLPSQRTELFKVREAAWRAWFGGDEATLRTILPREFIALGDGAQGWGDLEATVKSSLAFARSGGRLVKLVFPRSEVQSYGATAVIYTTYLYEIETGGTRATETGSAIEVFVSRRDGWIHTGWQLRADTKQSEP